MRKVIGIIVLLAGIAGSLVLYTNCNPQTSNQSLSNTVNASFSTPLPILQSQTNVVAVTVGCGYVNEPCVSVTVCIPGTTQCQVIPNILVDTGSYGLRIFSQVTNDWQSTTPLISLPYKTDPLRPQHILAECVSYADGSADWGPLANADIQLGGETASNVPVQIINSNFSTIPTSCTDADTDPISAGFNGILGVGLFVQDCGAGCEANQLNGIYYSCPVSGTGACKGAAVVAALQVSNPVYYLPVDNNGVVLALPNVSDAGASTLSGYLVLGIGTQNNNSPSGTTTFLADNNGNFSTTFNGVVSSASFVDSGSNALYFPTSSGVPVCNDDANFYCPASLIQAYTATQTGAEGMGTYQVNFNVASADLQFSDSNPNMVFNNLAGVYSQFDWGLPFFLGRNIFVGLEGQASSAGTGPYWAY